MDLAAFTLARDHNIPINIFNLNKSKGYKKPITLDFSRDLVCLNKKQTEVCRHASVRSRAKGELNSSPNPLHFSK